MKRAVSLPPSHQPLAPGGLHHQPSLWSAAQRDLREAQSQVSGVPSSMFQAQNDRHRAQSGLSEWGWGVAEATMGYCRVPISKFKPPCFRLLVLSLPPAPMTPPKRIVRVRSGAGEGNRAFVASLEDCISTMQLHPSNRSHPATALAMSTRRAGTGLTFDFTWAAPYAGAHETKAHSSELCCHASGG